MGFLLSNTTRFGRLWRSCVSRSLMKSEVRRTRTHYHTDDGTSDFMSTAASSLTTPLHLTSSEIARREIQVWKSRTIPLPKTSNPLKEWRRGEKIFPWLSLLARRVLAIPATSAAPERLFSTWGNTMTKKRCSLSCDHLEEGIYMRRGAKSGSGPLTRRSTT